MAMFTYQGNLLGLDGYPNWSGAPGPTSHQTSKQRSNSWALVLVFEDLTSRFPEDLLDLWCFLHSGKLYTKLLKMAIEIVDLPIKNGDFP